MLGTLGLLSAPVQDAWHAVARQLNASLLKQVALGVVLFLALCYVMPVIVFPAVFESAFTAPDILACEASSQPCI